MGVIRRIAATICLLVLAGCSSQSAIPTASPKQLLAVGTQELVSLSSVRVTGTFTIDQTSGAIAASILRNGDVSGLLTLGSTASNFVDVSGTTYFESFASFVLYQFPPSIITLATSVKGTPWWIMPGSAQAAYVVRFLSFDGLASLFLSGTSALTETPSRDSRGRAAYRLSDPAGSIFVATSQPHQVLEIKTSSHEAAGGLADVDLVFTDFNASATVAVPTYALIPDPAHLPPHFYIDSVGFNSCGASGCDLKAVVKADAGSGVATVTLTISDSAGERLGDCTTKASLANYKSSDTVVCHVGGTTWTKWWYQGVGKSSIQGEVANPDYYGG